MDGGDARRRGGCRVLDGLHSVQAAEEQYLSDFLLHSIILTRIENRAPYDTPATTSPMVSEHFLLCLDLDVLFFFLPRSFFFLPLASRFLGGYLSHLLQYTRHGTFRLVGYGCCSF